MANVKFNENTYYVPTDHCLIGVKQQTAVYKDSTASSKSGSANEGQVFLVLSETNHMYHIKPGWIQNEACVLLDESPNEVVELEEAFVVKVISNVPVFTEPSINAHNATVLRIGDLQRVIGESEDFYQLEHGGYIEKQGCRRY